MSAYCSACVSHVGLQIIKNRTHHHITKTRQGQTFSPEFGGFSLGKVGEFRLNPGSRTKFANLPDFVMRWLVHSLITQATEPYSDNLLNRTRNPSEPYSDKEILREATLQKCGVKILLLFPCQRCREIWREILVKFSACSVSRVFAGYTLPALQKTFVRIFSSNLPGNFALKKVAGIVGEFFLVSVSHETKHENTSKKFGANCGAKFGTIIRKFHEDSPWCWKLLSLNSARLSAPDLKTRPSHLRPMSEPPLNHVRTTSKPHPNHVQATSEPHPKQWQKLREKWFLAPLGRASRRLPC